MIHRLWCSYRGGCDGFRVTLGEASTRYPTSHLYACARCRRLWVWLPSWGRLDSRLYAWVTTSAELEWGRDAA